MCKISALQWRAAGPCAYARVSGAFVSDAFVSDAYLSDAYLSDAYVSGQQ